MISAADRISQIRKSQQVFVCGLFGLLPLIGFIPAICAVALAMQLSYRFKDEWNPAALYVRLGVALAILNLAITNLAGLILFLKLMPPFGND